ncbi:hypothetical protein [Pseudoalteromonas aurantia]|uniref:Uncharacterized protein n=1 Tax=Pseudoalteromonas aurantia 208 TaxID=1314867 RepID=A0ABR9EE95_9GAMM|nr:hypothetical protein [Pseudoalteromonas aurantia]MBE0368704.1 hypothetical protein [Pseudoalteromonas aurantia 208]
MIFLIKENGKSSKAADKYLLSSDASTLVSGGSVPDKPPRPTAVHEKQPRTASNQLTENELTKQSCALISGGLPIKPPRTAAVHEKQSRTASNQLTENELTKQSCALISGGTVPVKRPRTATAIVISISPPPVPLIDSQG